MTKKLEFREVRPEAFVDVTRDRLVDAVKVWVDEAGGADPQDLLQELNKTVIEQVLETEMDGIIISATSNMTRSGTGRATTATGPAPRR